MESNSFKRPRLGPRHRFWRQFLRLCFAVEPGFLVAHSGYCWWSPSGFWWKMAGGPLRQGQSWTQQRLELSIVTNDAKSKLKQFCWDGRQLVFLGEFMESNFFRRPRLGPHHRFWRRFLRLCFAAEPGCLVVHSGCYWWSPSGFWLKMAVGPLRRRRN